MSLVNFLVLQSHLHLCWQFQQPQIIGDGSAIFPHLLREPVLRERILLDEVLISQSDFNGVEILALYVFNQRHLHHVLVVSRADIRRNRVQSSQLRSTPAPFSGNDLIEAVVHFSERDGLDDTNLSDAFGQFLQGGGVKFPARLVGVGLNATDGHFVDGRRTARMHLLR